ncbi:dCMP deaminase [Talaromyces islandicus]|uniref:dCMP deaminase n=1 Tax=Talaromyces islandicus TaxID=28573 RepID=A0A0U1LQ65_TALIS|nr:dCMP deaminase [Talaromyces islandicus]
MLIGLCGGICAGKHTIADYLIREQGFQWLELTKSNPAPVSGDSENDTYLQESAIGDCAKGHRFESTDTFVDFVTKRWTERWVTTDIWDRSLLDKLLIRPFFLLVSVDAPVNLRWQRFRQRCSSRQLEPAPLEKFMLWSDRQLYDRDIGQAYLVDRASVRLFNASSSLKELYAALETVELPNEERLRPSWDQYFMQLASLAAQRSNCMKRRVGCVIVRDRRVISTGYNGTPRNITNCNEGGCPRCNSGEGGGAGLSTCLCLHAEENALLEAVKIAQVGITEVVYSKSYNMDKESAAILGAAGVNLRQLSQVKPMKPIARHIENLANYLTAADWFNIPLTF